MEVLSRLEPHKFLKTKAEREVVQYIEYIGGEDNGNEGC